MPPRTRLCPPCNVCSNFPGAVGGDGGDDENDKEKEEEAERERQEAIREAEERRKEKHRKMEEEREKMRQEIRDKVSTLLLYAKASSTVSRYYLTPPIYVCSSIIQTKRGGEVTCYIFAFGAPYCCCGWNLTFWFRFGWKKEPNEKQLLSPWELMSSWCTVGWLATPRSSVDY